MEENFNWAVTDLLWAGLQKLGFAPDIGKLSAHLQDELDPLASKQVSQSVASAHVNAETFMRDKLGIFYGGPAKPIGQLLATLPVTSEDNWEVEKRAHLLQTTNLTLADIVDHNPRAARTNFPSEGATLRGIISDLTWGKVWMLPQVDAHINEVQALLRDWHTRLVRLIAGNTQWHIAAIAQTHFQQVDARFRVAHGTTQHGRRAHAEERLSSAEIDDWVALAGAVHNLNADSELVVFTKERGQMIQSRDPYSSVKFAEISKTPGGDSLEGGEQTYVYVAPKELLPWWHDERYVVEFPPERLGDLGRLKQIYETALPVSLQGRQEPSPARLAVTVRAVRAALTERD